MREQGRPSSPARNDASIRSVRPDDHWADLRIKAQATMARLLAPVWRLSPKVSGNLGKWDRVYHDLATERLWGDETTYRLAAEFLADLDLVEDWGCGSGGFRYFCKTKYVGVDGSATPFADRIVDLCNYTSSADGILLRHVLEHNLEWEDILRNAVRSFQKKLCIILFTPFGRKTRAISYNPAIDVVNISFRKDDIVRHLSGCRWSLEEGIRTGSYYEVEHIFFVSR